MSVINSIVQTYVIITCHTYSSQMIQVSLTVLPVCMTHLGFQFDRSKMKMQCQDLTQLEQIIDLVFATLY